MMKHILLSTFVACCFSTLCHAQSIGEWQVYPSYWIATQNVTVGTKVYGLMNGNLLCFDTEDSSVKTYDCLNDVNDVCISYIAYSESAKALILLYDNGNIDIMDMDDNVWNVPGLKNSTLTNKDINGVMIDEGIAYVCTGFGFLTVDMNEAVILDTYNIDKNIVGMAMGTDKIYFATANNLYATSIDSNWHIASNWTGSSDMARTDVVYSPSDYNYAGGYYWHSDDMNGLVACVKEGDEYVPAGQKIQPNSPVRDLSYRMQYVGDRLLVAGGINTVQSIYNPATAMYFEDGKWTNFDEVTPAEEYPNLRHYNTTNLVQDPLDSNHHFASPYRTGLYEYRNAEFVGLYNYTNSPIQYITGINNNRENYTCAVALQYDSDGNLWMANQQTDTIIRVLTPSGEWRALYYSDIEGTSLCDDFLFTSSGVNFLVCRRMDNRGFFAFTTNNTLGTTADDRHTQRATIINEDGTSYAPDRFYCLAEDLDGQVWCGTDLGLFVIEDPTTYFNTDFRFLQVKIPRNDGSGLADYLLSGVPISYIAVDGANRKWIGTEGNGIYLISADGQEMLHHFQADDSPLLSDNIQCIAIHPTTGLVMIGTDKGLCSYMSDATEAEEELNKDNVKAYPNPVRPDYTGPITVDGLTMDSEVKICTSTGQLVWSGHSNGGRFTWNGCNKQGRRVASGVYNVVANNSDGKKAVVTRIIVIK